LIENVIDKQIQVKKSELPEGWKDGLSMLLTLSINLFKTTH